jgi:uncharacterized membrane protein YagU involved in acid resistance
LVRPSPALLKHPVYIFSEGVYNFLVVNHFFYAMIPAFSGCLLKKKFRKKRAVKIQTDFVEKLQDRALSLR